VVITDKLNEIISLWPHYKRAVKGEDGNFIALPDSFSFESYFKHRRRIDPWIGINGSHIAELDNENFEETSKSLEDALASIKHETRKLR